MDLLEDVALQWGLNSDVWRALCEAQSLYDLSMSGIRGLIEEWTYMSVNVDLHEQDAPPAFGWLKDSQERHDRILGGYGML